MMGRREEIYRGKKISLFREEHRLPNGRTAHLEVVRHPGAVVILPVAEDGRVFLLKQYRPALAMTLYEFPAGTLEPGEPPLVTARRELEEEIGMAGKIWTDLGTLFPAPGFCDEKQSLFLARELTPSSRPADDDEVIEPILCTVPEVENLVKDGALIDAKSLAIFLKARLAGLI